MLSIGLLADWAAKENSKIEGRSIKIIQVKHRRENRRKEWNIAWMSCGTLLKSMYNWTGRRKQEWKWARRNIWLDTDQAFFKI